MKSKKLEYTDGFTCEAIRIAVQDYCLKILEFEKKDAKTAFITVEGKASDVRRFSDDLNEDSLETFESKRDLSDEDYEFWLKTELKKFGIAYKPTKYKD